MRSPEVFAGLRTVCLSLVACLWATSSGCASDSGIRALNERELKYFKGLQGELKASSGRIDDLMSNNDRGNEEQALREITDLEDKIRMAKTVYSVHELLTAPQDDRASYIIRTRSKVIDFHLAEVADAAHDKMLARLAVGDEKRREVLATHRELTKLVAVTVEANKLLHNYFNRPISARIAEVFAEVSRQVAAFNENIQTLDQDNPVIARLTELGKTAEKRMDRAEDYLMKTADIWQKLNK